LLASPTGF